MFQGNSQLADQVHLTSLYQTTVLMQNNIVDSTQGLYGSWKTWKVMEF